MAFLVPSPFIVTDAVRAALAHLNERIGLLSPSEDEDFNPPNREGQLNSFLLSIFVQIFLEAATAIQ